MTSPLTLTRAQILGFRRRGGALEERLAPGPRSQRIAAWAGLQDSGPRAALLSLHARVRGTTAVSWEDPGFEQVWGPRGSAYLVSAPDRAVFTLGRLREDAVGRARAERLAAALRDHLGGARGNLNDIGRAFGVHPNMFRYAAPTGTVLIRWDGARRPEVWSVDAPEVDPAAARLELARRHLHVFGPTTAPEFTAWAGIPERAGVAAFEALRPSLTAVRTPLGEAWILASDEPELRRDGTPSDSVRLLPSGDAYFLARGAERELLVPDVGRRAELWTPRVWPGAILLHGEIRGTWRRANQTLTVQAWGRLTRRERDAVEQEAVALPIPGAEGRLRVLWG